MKKTSTGGNEPVPFTKVYISDELGYITPKKIGTTTLENGNYQLSLPSTLVNGLPIPLIDGKYITASVGQRRIVMPLKGQNVYDFDVKDTAFFSSEEVTVKPNPKKPINWLPFVITGSVLLIAGIAYAVYKKKTN